MSIVAVHGPYTFGSKGITEVGPAQAVPNPTNGLIWTFKLDKPSTRTTSLAWTFPTGTPASATGPGPHVVTFGSAGSKAVTAVATGVGEGANPYPPAGTTNIPVTAVTGTGPPGTSLRSVGPEEEGEEASDVGVGYDPAAHTVDEVKEFVTEHPDEARAMYDAEVAGKNRATLISWLEENIPFDPGDYTIDEVKEYVTDNPDEINEVLDAEAAGKNRVTLVGWLEDFQA